MKAIPLTSHGSFAERFTQIITLLCGQSPPPAQVAAWLNPDAEDISLQDWVVVHMRPRWAQGIELLDSAHQIADTPEEGSVGFERSPLSARIESLQSENTQLKALLDRSLAAARVIRTQQITTVTRHEQASP